MNKRLLSVLAFAILVAGAASFLLYQQLAKRMTVTQLAATTRIIVASRDLGIGTIIGDMDVRPMEWSGAVPQGALQKKEDVVGRGVVEPIYGGEPVRENRLAARGAGGGLAAMIPTGMRAVALPVGQISGVGGFVTPGMRVDLLISGLPPGTQQSTIGTHTKTLLQNIEVLSAGQDIQRDAEGKPRTVPVINVLATPEQAEVLSLASAETRIQLVLRNPLDKEEAKTPGTTVQNLWKGSGSGKEQLSAEAKARAPKRVAPLKLEAAKPKPEIPTIQIEVFNGSQKTETKFKEEPKSGGQ